MGIHCLWVPTEMTYWIGLHMKQATPEERRRSFRE
jgi:hypothetical protein